MLVVWNRAASYDGRSKVSTWIFAIGYRKALKALSRLDEPIDDEGGDDQPAPPEAGPEHRAARSQMCGAGAGRGPALARAAGGCPPGLFPRHRLPRDRRHRRLPGRHREDAHVPRPAQAQDPAGRPAGGLAVSGRVVHLGTDVHLKVQSLLPWYVGATPRRAGARGRRSPLGRLPALPGRAGRGGGAAGRLCGHRQRLRPGDADQEFAAVARAPRRRRGATGASRLAGAACAIAGAKSRPGPAGPWPANACWSRPWAACSCCRWGPNSASARSASLRGAPGADGGNLIVRFRPRPPSRRCGACCATARAGWSTGRPPPMPICSAVPAGLETAAVARLRKENAVLLVEPLDGRAVP